VVYAPRKPIVSAERSHGEIPHRSVASVKTRPSVKAPLMLTTNVPHGNVPSRAG